MKLAERLYIDDPNISDGEKIQFIVRYRFATMFTSGKRVVDIGCAGGYGSAILAENAGSVVGIDYSEEAINRARKRWTGDNLHFIVGQAEGMKHGIISAIEQGKVSGVLPGFEVAVAFELLEHVEDPDKFLMEVAEILIGDGILILSTPFYHFTGKQPEVPGYNPFHLWVWHRQGLKELLEKYFVHVTILVQHVTAFHILESPIGTSWIAVCNGVKR